MGRISTPKWVLLLVCWGCAGPRSAPRAAEPTYEAPTLPAWQPQAREPHELDPFEAADAQGEGDWAGEAPPPARRDADEGVPACDGADPSCVPESSPEPPSLETPGEPSSEP